MILQLEATSTVGGGPWAELRVSLRPEGRLLARHHRPDVPPTAEGGLHV